MDPRYPYMTPRRLLQHPPLPTLLGLGALQILQKKCFHTGEINVTAFN